MIKSLCELEKRMSIFDLQSDCTLNFEEICPLFNQINISNKYSKLVEAYTLQTGFLSENLIIDLKKYGITIIFPEMKWLKQY